MKYIESVKKAIVFTDVKDFTLKNSLLTQLQIREFLNTQDGLVIPTIEKYDGKLIKTIGDGFMIIFDDVISAINASIEIQEKLKHYNSKVNFNLHKIELRIIVNYGDVQKEQTLVGEDYFGDIINIASRLQYEVIENKIYTTKNVIDELKERNNFHYKYLGKTTLRGILYEVEVYEILYDEKSIEFFKDTKYKKNDILLTPTLEQKLNEVNNMILEFSLITTIVGIQNISPISGYIMLPFHIFLLKKIANKFGVNILAKKELIVILLTIFFSLSLIFLIRKFTFYISHTTSLAGYTSYFIIVLNFCLSYFIGKILSNYFYKEGQKIENKNKELKNMLKHIAEIKVKS